MVKTGQMRKIIMKEELKKHVSEQARLDEHEKFFLNGQVPKTRAKVTLTYRKIKKMKK